MRKNLMFVRFVFIFLVLLALLVPTVALACGNDPPGPQNAYQNGPGPQYQWEYQKGGEISPQYQNQYRVHNSPADSPGYQHQLQFKHCDGKVCWPLP